MPMAFPPPTTSSTSTPYRSRFGDTTWTKVFVGGLAWETPTEELRRHFETFGDILEAVVIADKTTGRSKGYGFVTFREPEAARRAVENANPVIDGRRANCNIAALARPRTSPRQQGRFQSQSQSQEGSMQQQEMGPTYGRVPAQVGSPWIYPTPYGYMASYPSEHGYQQAAAVYSPEMGSYYYQQIYGPTRSLINVGSPPYRHYPNVNMGYPMQMQSRAGYPSLGAGQDLRPPFMQYPTAHMDGAPFPPPPPPYHYHPFQLQAPPHARIQLNPTLDSRAPREPSTSGASTENQEV